MAKSKAATGPSQIVEWSDTDKTSVRQIQAGLLELYSMPPPVTNEEIQERIDRYFSICQHEALRPGVETLSLSLHICRQTLYRWCRGIGCDSERQRIVCRARQFIAGYIEQAALTGRLNPVTSIFLLRNWEGYKNEGSFDDNIPEGIIDSSIESPQEILERRRRQPPTLPDFDEDD